MARGSDRDGQRRGRGPPLARRWSPGRGACKLPDGAVRFVDERLHGVRRRTSPSTRARGPCAAFDAPAALPVPASREGRGDEPNASRCVSTRSRASRTASAPSCFPSASRSTTGATRSSIRPRSRPSSRNTRAARPTPARRSHCSSSASVVAEHHFPEGGRLRACKRGEICTAPARRGVQRSSRSPDCCCSARAAARAVTTRVRPRPLPAGVVSSTTIRSPVGFHDRLVALAQPPLPRPRSRGEGPGPRRDRRRVGRTLLAGRRAREVARRHRA